MNHKGDHKMKKVIAVACLLGSTVALSACGNTGTGYVDTQPPYSHERTASHADPVAPAPVRTAAPVFEARVLK